MVVKEQAVSEPSNAVEHISLEDQVYQRIKSAILNRELRPGEKISLADWAERLNSSRTPVRDALKRLENEGLIIRETERVWHIYTLTIDDVTKIFDARIATDGRIAYLAALNATDETIAAFKQIIETMELTSIENNYDEFTAENSKFHALLNHAADNEYLATLNRYLHEKTTRLYPKGINIDHRLEKGLKENRLIVEAIIEHDPQKAQQYQEKHVRSYRDHLIRVIQEMVIPYTGPEF